MGFRAWLVAAVLTLEAVAQAQPSLLRVRITIVDASQQTRPVPRHALLISENPTSAAPQRMVTNGDGTAEIRLRPGNYTIESDEPLLFQGQTYEWRRTVDVPAGQTTTIDLNAGDAEVGSADALSASAPGSARNASGLLLDWQDSVVTIWSPLKRGAGFLIDARGLILTTQRLAAAEKTLEVQLSPSVKVAGRVLISDADRGVAVVWIDPKTAVAARPMTLKFADSQPAIAEKDKLFTISAPIDDDKRLSSGTVNRITARGIVSDIHLEDEDAGAPLFTADGAVVAITIPQNESRTPAAVPITAVKIDEARAAIAAAEKKLLQESAPTAVRLPVEGDALFPDDPLREAAGKRKGALTPYRLSSEDFDVSLITPLLAFAARHQGGEASASRRPPEVQDAADREAVRRALQEFGNWWDYVRRDPPVLMIRATPKMVEGFWKSVLRGAAQTQGVSLPAIKRIKAGFSRMQVFCGDSEVVPIHPFRIENRIGETDAVYEGFYIYDPAAIGPHCGTVRLTLFSEKTPDKPDTRAVDPKVLQQIYEDFAPYRTRR